MPRTQLCAEKPLHVMVHVHADWNWKDGKHILVYESEFSDETSVGHVHTYTLGVFLGSPSSVLFPFGIYCIGMYIQYLRHTLHVMRYM